MQGRRSCDFDALIWQTQDSTLAQHQTEYSQRRTGFFASQVEAAKRRKEERLRRQELRKAERRRIWEERWQADHARGYQPCKVVSREDAPAYLRRQFIYNGYLVGGTPGEAAWNTLFSLNNETLNAWTMIGGPILAFLGVFMAGRHMASETVAFWVLLLSCVPHAPFSIGLHLTDGTCRSWRDLWRGLDVFFIFTCGVPRSAALAWYVFYGWRQYAAFMAIALSIYGQSVYKNILCGRVKDISKPALAKAMTATIACYASPVMIAAFQEYLSTGWGPICKLATAILGTFVASALTYGCKYPERLAPGMFDLIGNGHQLMHVSATVEYGLELLFLWHMAAQRAAVKQSIAAEDLAISSLLHSVK